MHSGSTIIYTDDELLYLDNYLDKSGDRAINKASILYLIYKCVELHNYSFIIFICVSVFLIRIVLIGNYKYWSIFNM